MPAPRERIQEAYTEHWNELDLAELMQNDSLAAFGYRLYRAGWIRGEAFTRRQQMDAEREAELHRYVPPDATVLPSPQRYQRELESPRLPIAPSMTRHTASPVAAPLQGVPMDFSLGSEPGEPPIDTGLTLEQAQSGEFPLTSGNSAVDRRAAAAAPARRRVEDLWPPAPGRSERDEHG